MQILSETTDIKYSQEFRVTVEPITIVANGLAADEIASLEIKAGGWVATGEGLTADTPSREISAPGHYRLHKGTTATPTSLHKVNGF